MPESAEMIYFRCGFPVADTCEEGRDWESLKGAGAE